MRREGNVNKFFIISIVCVSILVISLIGFMIAKSNKRANENQFAEQMSSLNKELSESESASTQIGKSIEEIEEEDFEMAELVENEDSKEENSTTATSVEKNTQNSAVETNSNTVEENVTDENHTAETNAEESKTEEKKETIELAAPVKGEILREFAKDSLIYSETLQEWITHNGIDIKADKTSVVKAAASGTVSAIKNDPRYGLTVIINHDNGYQTVYSNLLTAEFVVKGEKVEKEQTIGTVGNSASFEIADSYHLHFELLRNNEYLDPVIYMNAD